MNEHNQKLGFTDQRFKKALLFLVIFWSFPVKKARNFIRFTSLTFANLRLWEMKTLFYDLFKLSLKRLRKYGEGGIRTLGTRLKVQRFSKA